MVSPLDLPRSMAGVVATAARSLIAESRPLVGDAVRVITELPWIPDGSSSSGVPVGQPANLGAVMHASRLVVEPLASMPWVVRSGVSQVPAPRWVTDPQLLRQDARFPVGLTPAAMRKSRVEFWSEWILDALWNGAGYLMFLEDAQGAPVAGSMRVINSQFVLTDVYAGDIRWRIGGDPQSPSLDLDAEGRVHLGDRTWRMVMLRGEPPYDPMTGRGLGVIQRAAQDLDLLARIQAYSRGTYRSGVPAGYLKASQPGLTKAQADDLKAKWMAAHGNDSRSVAVLNSSTEFTPIGISPEDMAVVESKRMSLLDVALAFGVPPYQMGAASNTMTYSNTETEFQSMVTITHSTKAARIESVLSSLLPAGQDLDIDFRGMLRGDSAARTAYYSAGIRDGWLSWQIASREEGYDPAEVAEDKQANARALPPAPDTTNDQAADDEEVAGDDAAA